MDEKITKKLLKKVVKDYDNIAEEFNSTRRNIWDEFNVFLPYIKENSILIDLGCGNGRFYNFLKNHKKSKYIGIDNNKKLLEKAKKSNKDTKFVYGDLLKIPLKNNYCDVLCMIASLHHIPSKKLKEEALKEANRILKKGGILIISVWNLFQPKYKKYITHARIKSLLTLKKYDSRDAFIPWGNSGIKRYYYAFKPVELKGLIEKSGFGIIKEDIGKNISFICKKK